MTLLRVLAWVAVVDTVAIGATAYAIVGRDRLMTTARQFSDRLRQVALPVAVLVVVLVVNSVVRELVTDIAWLIGINVTPTIYAIEGDLVPWIQTFTSTGATVVFSYAYVYGYVYLLVFPLLAYVALDDLSPLRKLIVAYSVNYAIGLACYLLFVAYGPRNLLYGSVESLLYTHHPEFQFLTSEVNSNTNVFPSLHASMSATVIAVAYDTRSVYPAWFPVATVVGLLVIVATMYLGIHWAIDVLVGLVLAGIAVSAGRRYVS